MTYRGIYRDGIVVLQGEVDLQDGAHVEVNPARVGKARAKTKSAVGGRLRAKPGRSAKAKSAKHPLPGFGAWKHRTDIVDSAKFARALRRKASTRRSAG